jgi:hypothetical protein
VCGQAHCWRTAIGTLWIIILGHVLCSSVMTKLTSTGTTHSILHSPLLQVFGDTWESISIELAFMLRGSVSSVYKSSF